VRFKFLAPIPWT